MADFNLSSDVVKRGREFFGILMGDLCVLGHKLR